MKPKKCLNVITAVKKKDVFAIAWEGVYPNGVYCFNSLISFTASPPSLAKIDFVHDH